MRWGGAAAEGDAAGCSWAVQCRGAERGPFQARPAEAVCGVEFSRVSRLSSPSPPRPDGSECGLTASVPLSEVGVQTDSAALGAASGDGALADLRSLAKEELQARKALANASGSELCLLLANALWQEVATRAAGEGAARAERAQARAEAAAAEAHQVVVVQKVMRERDAAREELRAAAAARHSAQRRHASAMLLVEQLETHAANLQLRFQSLAEEHGAFLQKIDNQQAELHAALALQHTTRVRFDTLANQNALFLQQRDDLASTARALQQSKDEQEARAAANEAAQQHTVARLREELRAGAHRCSHYERQLACHRTLQSICSVEAAGRAALAWQLSGAWQQLRAEHEQRGRIVASEVSRRHQLQYSLKYTGPAAEHRDAMPSGRALMVHTVCHGVAVFVPEDWAPVCSVAARASLAVMQVHSLGWKAGDDMLGAFRSRGQQSGFDNHAYGPEPGPLYTARVEIDALVNAVMPHAVPGQWGDWHNRWVAHMDLQMNLYEEMRLRHLQLCIACNTLMKKATGAADRIHQALTMFQERTEAEDGVE